MQLYDRLKYIFPNLERTTEVVDFLDRYTISEVDIHEPLDGEYVSIRQWATFTDWSGREITQYHDSVPFAIIGRASTSVDNGIDYRGFYLENDETLDARKRLVDFLMDGISQIYEKQQSEKKAIAEAEQQKQAKMDKLNSLIAKVGIDNTIKVLECLCRPW